MLEEGFNVVTINPVSEKVSILSCYDQTHGFAFTCLVPLPFESYDAQLSNVSLVPAQNYNSAYKKKGRTQCRRLPALCGVWGKCRKMLHNNYIAAKM